MSQKAALAHRLVSLLRRVLSHFLTQLRPNSKIHLPCLTHTVVHPVDQRSIGKLSVVTMNISLVTKLVVVIWPL